MTRIIFGLALNMMGTKILVAKTNKRRRKGRQEGLATKKHFEVHQHKKKLMNSKGVVGFVRKYISVGFVETVNDFRKFCELHFDLIFF